MVAASHAPRDLYIDALVVLRIAGYELAHEGQPAIGGAGICNFYCIQTARETC